MRPVVPANLTPEQIAFLPVTALAMMIETKQITSTELTEIYLARLKRHGETLKCVVTLTEELALSRPPTPTPRSRPASIAGRCMAFRGARRICSRPKASRPPGARRRTRIKSSTSTPPSSSGCAMRARCSSRSCRWARSRRAACGSAVRRGIRGTRSAARADRRQARASATAAGLVGFSIGTETLGSIISPSVTNGVTGLRPTYGRVSRYGAMALSWTMDKIGPMCRSVEDCVLVLNAIYGSDGKDDTCTDAPFEWNSCLYAAIRRRGGQARTTARVAQDRLHPEGTRGRAEQSATRPTRSGRPSSARNAMYARGARRVSQARREARADGDAGLPRPGRSASC